MERIYVNGNDIVGKAYFTHSRGGLEFTCDDESAEDDIREGVAAQFQTDLDARDAWDRLKAACSAPRYRPQAPTPHVRSSPVSARSAALDFTTKYVVPELPVVIEIDHREPEEFDEILGAVPNVTVERKHLPLGDFVINRKPIYVERKTVADLKSSVVGEDKRLFNQIEKMGFQDNALSFVIIEGDMHNDPMTMPGPELLGTLSYLSLLKGVSIIPTTDIRMSSYLILKIARHDVDGLGYNLALRALKPKAMLDARRFLLEGLPGVSAGLATRLLDAFGSVNAVMNATRERLLEVDGVGPKTADAILALIHAT